MTILEVNLELNGRLGGYDMNVKHVTKGVVETENYHVNNLAEAAAILLALK